MSRIDDPLDQIYSQHRDDDQQGLTIGVNLAAAIAGLLTGAGGAAMTSIMAFAANFSQQRRQESRAEAIQEGLRNGFRDCEGRLETVEQKIAGLEAEEAFVTAFRHSLNSARLDKARMFGRILGGTLADNAPNWQEAAEFVRNLEQFSDDDVEALKTLWDAQREAQRIMAKGQREMSTDANDYTETWKAVLAEAEKQGISRDDWDSRCARLSGFGLAALVQPNSSRQSPSDMCYRLTGRAVRLLKLLGRNTDRSAYPSVRYHATKEPVTVNNEDEDHRLGPDWKDTPATRSSR